jgi:porin
MLDIQEKKMRALKLACMHAAVAGTFCAGLMAGSAFAAGEPTPAVDSKPVVKKPAKPHKKYVKAKQYVPSGPVYKSDPVVAAAPIPACSAASAAALMSKYSVHSWEIPWPSFQDSITQDSYCWRSNLAKYGFGFSAWSSDVLQSNMLNHYVPPSSGQHYPGQRTASAYLVQSYLTYDLSQYGIPDGQLQLGGFVGGSTDINWIPNGRPYLTRAAYYQTAFNKALEINIGQMDVAEEFIGTQTGGNVFNVLGPSGSILSVLGGGNFGASRPGAQFTWHVTDRFYDKFGVMESNPTSAYQGPAGGSTSGFPVTSLTTSEIANYSNPNGFKFATAPNVQGYQYPYERQLFINEIGYKNVAAPGDPFTWVRLTALYNDGSYANLRYSGKYGKGDEAVTLYADRQIWQADPSSPQTAYKGIYVGGAASWANPVASQISADFQAKIYSVGMFGRPKDMLSFVWEQTRFSPIYIDNVNSGAYGAPICNGAGPIQAGTLCAHHATNSFTLVYLANIFPGVYASLGAAYVDNPSALWSPLDSTAGSSLATAVKGPLAGTAANYNINHSINFLASLFINL